MSSRWPPANRRRRQLQLQRQRLSQRLPRQPPLQPHRPSQQLRRPRLRPPRPPLPPRPRPHPPPSPAAAAAAVPPAISQPPEVKDLKVGILPIAALTPPVVAQKLGYFKDEGFNNVEFTTLGGGAELLPAVEAGRLDFALSAYYSVYLARQQNFDFWIATNNDSATDGPEDGYAVLVKNESPIKTVKDLEGKKVATNTVPSIGMGYLNAVMKKAGADFKKVDYVELGFPQMPDALVNNQVDAAAMLEPGQTQALATGRARVISYPYVEVTPGVDLGGFIATQKWLRANPNAADHFARALARGTAYMNESDARARQEIIEYTKMDPAIANKMHLPIWRTKVDPAKAQQIADMMFDQGVLKDKMDVSKFIWSSALR